MKGTIDTYYHDLIQQLTDNMWVFVCPDHIAINYIDRNTMISLKALLLPCPNESIDSKQANTDIKLLY